MDLRLSADQVAFGQAVRSLLDSAGGTLVARRFAAGEPTTAVDLWRELAAAGVPGILVPEDRGGLGLGLVSAVPVLEELGRALAPGPFAETYVLAAAAFSRMSDPAAKARLADIASGSLRVGLCFGGEAHLVRSSQGARLFVADALAFYPAHVDLLAIDVADGSSEGSHLVFVRRDSPGIRFDARTPVDPSVGIGLVWIDGPVMSPDTIECDPAGSRRAIDAFRVALACMLVGTMSRVLELSTDHAKTRTQFGQPIGRFQAIKHRLADMYSAVELSRSLCYDGALAIEEGRSDLAAAAAAAKAFATTSSLRVCLDGIQVHGGLGFTWESDMHLFLKRARSWEHYGGSPADCLDAMKLEVT